MENQQYIITPASAKAVEVKKDLSLDEAVHRWSKLLGSDEDRDSRPTMPYKQIDLVFKCVDKLISGILGLPPVISTQDDRIVESGPVYDLLFNSSLNWEQLATQAIGHYALSRDVFFVFLDKSPGQPPAEIFIVSGTQMHPITHNRKSNGELVGWEFRGSGGQKSQFSLDEVYQWKNFNPYDRFHGLGPATACKLNINYTYAATLFNSAALENGAEPGIILTAPSNLSEDQVRLNRSQFEARHAGAGKAKRTALLTGGLDIKTIAQSMVDMQVADLMTLHSARICSTFGVPPGVAGLITEAQYSHGPAQRDFIFNTIIPLAMLFAGHVTDGIISQFRATDLRTVALKDSRTCHFRSLATNRYHRRSRQKAVASQQQVFLWLDVSQHPTVQEVQDELAEKVLKFTEAGVPLNDLIRAHDLPYQENPWGDEWWIPMGQVPASFTLEAGLEGLTGPGLPEGETPGEEEEGKGIEDLDTKTKADEQEDDRQRLRVWRNWVISWAGLEREYNESLRKFFLRQQRILIQKLTKAYKELKFYDSKITTKDTEAIIANVVFDLKIENGKIKVINETFFGRAMELGIRQALTEASGLQDDAFEAAVDLVKRSQRLKAKRIISTSKITKVNKTTQAMVGRHLRAGLERGDSLNDLTKQIAKDLGSNRARALTIARTQTAGALDSGRHEGFRQSGVDGKSWITSGDDQVRDAHRAAGALYGKAIPLDQAFVVGGERLMYPGDPAGSAANIVNCRCLEIAMALRAERSVTDYINIKFYSYSDMRAAIK
jgi:HK97 family phage portal protein